MKRILAAVAVAFGLVVGSVAVAAPAQAASSLTVCNSSSSVRAVYMRAYGSYGAWTAIQPSKCASATSTQTVAHGEGVMRTSTGGAYGPGSHFQASPPNYYFVTISNS